VFLTLDRYLLAAAGDAIRGKDEAYIKVFGYAPAGAGSASSTSV
jgi:hypothetical protein